MTLDSIENRPLLKWVFVCVAFFGVALAFMIFFMQLNTEGNTLGIDNIFYALKNWDLNYTGRHGLKNPPWSVLLLLPVATLPDGAAWGLLVFFTVAILVLSVPQMQPRWRYWFSVFALITSFPAIRNIADANLEGLVIAGMILMLYAYKRENPILLAGGVLLATSKPQAVFLVMLVLGVYLLRYWHWKKWIPFGLCVLAVVIPSLLWRGERWINSLDNQYQAGSIIDIGLNAALNRLGGIPSPLIYLALGAVLCVTLYVSWVSGAEFTREKAGMLIAASLLLAPYAAGNTVINVLAIGMIPLLNRRFAVGLFFIILADLFYPFNAPEFTRVYAYYWTVYLVLAWMTLCWLILRSQREIIPETSL